MGKSIRAVQNKSSGKREEKQEVEDLIESMGIAVGSLASTSEATSFSTKLMRELKPLIYSNPEAYFATFRERIEAEADPSWKDCCLETLNDRYEQFKQDQKVEAEEQMRDDENKRKLAEAVSVINNTEGLSDLQKKLMIIGVKIDQVARQ